jgi:surfeit locus 1 family protein
MRQPPVMATLSCLAAFALLCALGAWQVQRLHWKEGLIAQLDAAYGDRNPPVFDNAAVDMRAASGKDFAAARMRGRFTGRQLLLGIRTWQGQAGYHVLAALEIPGGAVIVNRGWISVTGRKAVPPLPSGPVTVRGILHRPDRANPFVPANDPAAGTWYRWDMAAMAQALGVRQLAPLVLYEQEETGMTQDLPVRDALRWELPNSHRGYAFFWFSMAGVLAVIWYFRFVKKA